MPTTNAGTVREVTVEAAGVSLPGLLGIPEGSSGLIVFAHGSGSSRLSRRNNFVAGMLREAGFATLLFDLLTQAEEDSGDRRLVFDIDFLARRLGGATRWTRERPELRSLPIGYFGASTGAGAALAAAAEDPTVRAVVSRGGRPDLAGKALSRVTAPTLLIVGERDEPVIELNEQARDAMTCLTSLEIVPRATHLFEEPGCLEVVAALAASWFGRFVPDSEQRGVSPGVS